MRKYKTDRYRQKSKVGNRVNKTQIPVGKRKARGRKWKEDIVEKSRSGQEKERQRKD